MKRTLSLERLYSVANYNNIKFNDLQEFELPPEKALNQDLANTIYYSMMVNADLNFLRYLKLREMTNPMKLNEAINYLETEKANTLDEIQKELEE